MNTRSAAPRTFWLIGLRSWPWTGSEKYYSRDQGEGIDHVRFRKISNSGDRRGRLGHPAEPFLFSSSFAIYRPDSGLLGGHGLCIGVCAKEGFVKRVHCAKRKGRMQGAAGRQRVCGAIVLEYAKLRGAAFFAASHLSALLPASLSSNLVVDVNGMHQRWLLVISWEAHFIPGSKILLYAALRLALRALPFIRSARPRWDSSGPPCGPGRIQKRSPRPRKRKRTSAGRYRRSRYSTR